MTPGRAILLREDRERRAAEWAARRAIAVVAFFGGVLVGVLVGVLLCEPALLLDLAARLLG